MELVLRMVEEGGDLSDGSPHYHPVGLCLDRGWVVDAIWIAKVSAVGARRIRVEDLIALCSSSINEVCSRR